MPLTKKQLTKQDITKYVNALFFLSLGLAVITSQYSIASSSVGIGGLIIITAFRLITERNIYKVDKGIIYLFLIYILVQVISSVFCSSPAESFNNIYRRISIYIVFFAVIFFIKDERRLQKFLAVFFIFTALVSTVEIIRYFMEYNSELPIFARRLEYYGYPITNGEIKMLIMLLIVPLILSKENFVLNKTLLIVIAVPLLVTLYLTEARNAFLGVFTGLIIIGALKNKYFLIGIIVIVILFLLIAPFPLKERMLSITDFHQRSIQSRFMMWETGIRIIKDNPALGAGDVDINKVYRMYKTPEFHGEGSHMHSNIFQIAVNFGLPGLAAWLLLMGYIFYRQIKIYIKTRQNKFLNIIAVSSLVSMAAFQISGLTEWNFGDAEFAAVMWFNLALAFLSWKLYNKSAESENENNRQAQ